MDQTPTDQPIITPNEPMLKPTLQKVQSRHSPTKILILVLSVLLALSLVALTMVISRSNQKETTTASDTPSRPPPTPTPVRRASKIASEAAFMQLEITVASLSAIISGYPILDTSINPPKLIRSRYIPE